MRWSGGFLLACSCCLAGWVPPAAASRSAKPSSAQIVRALVGILRSDARQQTRRSDGAVTVTVGCCGRRTLRVHYRVRFGPPVQRDSYILRLETEHGRVESLAVSEFVGEAEHTNGRVWRESQFEYTIERVGRSPTGWGAGVSFGGGGGRLDTPPGEAQQGDAFYDACSLHGPVPFSFYRELVLILRNARRHTSSAAIINPRSHCL